jgi:hypothetical protein
MMTRYPWLLSLLALLAFAPALAFSADTPRAGETPRPVDVTIQVTQVKVLTEGPEAVDPALGDLGKQFKEKYPHRNCKSLGATSQKASEGKPATFQLANGMTMEVKVLSVKPDGIQLDIAINQGGKLFQPVKITPRNKATFIISVPWEKNVLGLAIRPSTN